MVLEVPLHAAALLDLLSKLIERFGPILRAADPYYFCIHEIHPDVVLIVSAARCVGSTFIFAVIRRFF